MNARGLRLAGVVVVTAAVAVAATALADAATLSAAVRAMTSDPLPIAAALVLYTLAFAVRAAAWGPLLPVTVPFARRLQALLGAIAVNHALPGPVGELARARIVQRDPDLPLRGALVSVAAARVADVGAIAALVVVCSLLAGEAPAWVRWAGPVALALPVVALTVARRRGALLTGRDALRVAVLVVPSWALECGVVWAVASGAGVQLSLPAAILVTCCGVLAQVAAVLPGGVGTYEAGTTSALVALGVPAGDALAIAVATHGVKFAYAFAAGIPALLPAIRTSARPDAPLSGLLVGASREVAA